MDDIISRKEALEALHGIKESLRCGGDPILAALMNTPHKEGGRTAHGHALGEDRRTLTPGICFRPGLHPQRSTPAHGQGSISGEWLVDNQNRHFPAGGRNPLGAHAGAAEGGNRMKGKRIRPTTGEVYMNRNGKVYLCGDVWDNNTPEPSFCARMTNTATGWTFTAHGIVEYEDGAIEWDYSTGGHFREVPTL